MRLLSVLTLLIIINTSTSRANEGLWLPLWLEKLNEFDMQFLGMKLSAGDIYHEDSASIKDAIVSFGGFCTGEFISPEGLVLTNHHCGYESIQTLSLAGGDYLKNGFWAKSKEEELPVEGLFVRILVRMEDVTAQVLDSAVLDMDVSKRQGIIRRRINEIEKTAKGDTHYRTQVKSFFEKNEYYLLVYEQFNDVRFVGAPPEYIGSFGGETDNWMWPRHTADFSMFRVYVDSTGLPANYSADNVPYQPKKFLPISTKGVKNGDFTMSLGFPGRTDRYLSSYGIDLAIKKINPTIVKIRKKKLDIMGSEMDTDEDVYLKYSKKYNQISNYWKYYIGQTKNLKRMRVQDKRMEEESKFQEWAKMAPDTDKKYGGIVDQLKKSYEEYEKYILHRYFISEAIITGPAAFTLSYFNIRRLYTVLKDDESTHEELEKEIESTRTRAEETFSVWSDKVEKEMLVEMLRMYNNDLPDDQKGSIFKEISSKYKNDFEKYVDHMFEKSFLTSESKLNAFLKNPSAKKLANDPCFKAFNSMYSHYATTSRKEIIRINSELGEAERLYLDGLRKMFKRKVYYPNANSTLRVSYGTVSDYYPMDGVYYSWKTTGEGILEKMDNSNPEFYVDNKLYDLLSNRKFDKYGVNDTMQICFITTNDQTGGSSGSPVINGNGEIIGISFDGNWEAMSGEIAYDPKFKRSIATDIRYVLFLIDKHGGAGHLINEMMIVGPESSAAQ